MKGFPYTWVEVCLGVIWLGVVFYGLFIAKHMVREMRAGFWLAGVSGVLLSVLVTDIALGIYPEGSLVVLVKGVGAIIFFFVAVSALMNSIALHSTVKTMEQLTRNANKIFGDD